MSKYLQEKALLREAQTRGHSGWFGELEKWGKYLISQF